MSRTLPLLLLAFAPLAARGDDEALARLAPLSGCERVFVGKLTSSKAGPVGLSDPPLHTFTLVFDPTDALRGEKPDAKAVYRFSYRGNNPAKYDVGTAYIVGAKAQQGGWLLAAIVPDTADERKVVKQVLSVPAGWRWADGKPVSPWASLGAKAWPKDGPKLADVTCGECGRPALFVGDGITLTVEQVPAKNPQKFKNDMYGDGAFKITLKNTTTKDATVPAVLTDGKEVLWADSVLFLHQDKPLVLPTAGKVTKGSKPLSLKAGESASGEVNSLLLDGVPWPRGGSRVYFDVAVGDRTANNFFYYYSAVHDQLRADALAEVKK